MTTFKKILALVLCLCTIFAFASCDTLTAVLEKINGTDNPTTPNAVTSPLTKEQWNAALKDELFNNVTFEVHATFEGEDEPESIICKLAGTRAAISEGGFEEEEVDSDTRDVIKSIYVNTILAMLKNFDNFTYDADAKAFVSANDIIYNVEDFEYNECNVKITTSGTKVKFDTNNNVAEISCHMKQEFVENGQPESLEFDAVFKFYDYGTTVIGSGKENYALLTAYYVSEDRDNYTIVANAYTINANNENEPYDYDLIAVTSDVISYQYNNMFFSTEGGVEYMYRLTEDGWVKVYAGSRPNLMLAYVGMFLRSFNDMIFDGVDSYYTTDLSASAVAAHYVKITVKDGLIYNLMFYYDNEDGTRTVFNFTFSNYGTTEALPLPTEYTDMTNGGGSTPSQGMTKAEWDEAFENTSAAENFTFLQSNTRIPNDGEPSTSTSILETTEFASHTTNPGSSFEAYHSIEDGNYYYYYNYGSGWTKKDADPGNSPIGSAVIQQFTELFKDLYDELTYDPETNSYVGGGFVLNQRGTDYTIHDFRIEFENGLISEIYYVSDMYSSSNGEMVLSGRGSSVIQIYNYGTTVVELPTEYTDNTTT